MIRSQRADAVALITIDRPQRRNALDNEHDAALAAAIAEAAANPKVRALVLTATGSTFCSGADLRERLPIYQRKVEAGESPDWSFGGITGLTFPPVPMIAAVNGHAIAGGMELALACDIRICVPEATFAMTEVKWAITPGAGGTQRLPRLIGAGLALDLLMTARAMTAEEALRCGLVSRIVDEHALVDEAMAIAAAIAEHGPLAVAAVRHSVSAGADLELAEALTIERNEFIATMRSKDAREGSRAFLQRRRPAYKGE